MAICDRYSDPQCQDLLGYAYYWFVEHFGEVDLSQADASTKQDIGRKLSRLLQEPALIESWWAQERMYLYKFFVFGEYAQGLLKTIHTWLKDPIVLKGMSDMPNEREFVIGVTAGGSPSFDIYSKVAKIMAARWIESNDPDVWLEAFSWLRGYVSFRRDEVPNCSLVFLLISLKKWRCGPRINLGIGVGPLNGTNPLHARFLHKIFANRQRRDIVKQSALIRMIGSFSLTWARYLVGAKSTTKR